MASVSNWIYSATGNWRWVSRKDAFYVYVTFSTVFLFSLYSSRAVALIPNVHLILAVVSLVVMYFFAPIEAQNKPLSKQSRRENRKRCIAVSWCAVGVSWFLCWWKWIPVSMLDVFYGRFCSQHFDISCCFNEKIVQLFSRMAE